jgi:Mg-chelatase subunit ChlD
MKTGYTHVSILIDKSGSMQSIKDDVIGGFNQLIEDQKKEPGELTVSLVQFDGNNALDFNVTNDFSPITKVILLNEKNYQPRGNTPLNDALARLILETGNKLTSLNENDRPEKVIFVCITDGQENSSREHTTASVKAMIEVQEKVYKWKFIYIGANQDSFTEAHSRGMGSSLNFDFDASGNKAMYSSLNKSLSKSRNVDLKEFHSLNLSIELKTEYDKEKDEIEKEKNKPAKT